MIYKKRHALSKTTTITVIIFSLLLTLNLYAAGGSKHESEITPIHSPSCCYNKFYGYITTSDSLDSNLVYILLSARVFEVSIINKNKI